MMGLFPSNFVEVLDDSFRPASRASSPMPGRSLSPSPFNPQPSVKAKSKPSRKPFQSYSQPDSAAMKRAELQKQDSLSLSRAPSPNPMSVHDNIGSVPSPQIRGYGSRAPSPAPPMHIGYGSGHPHRCPQDTMGMDLERHLQLHPSNMHITLEHHHQTRNSTLVPLLHLLHRRTELHIPRRVPSIHVIHVPMAITPRVELPLALHHPDPRG